jgi:hypothetical protein
MGPAGHEHHLCHPAPDQGLDRKADHRPVMYGQQVLVCDAGQRIQAAASTSREYDTFQAST